MSITIFPKKNTYLLLGLAQLKALISSSDSIKPEIIIIDLEPETLKEILLASWIVKYTGGKILLVADSRLMPLANYYKHANPHFIDVCSKQRLITSLLMLSEFGHLGTTTSVDPRYLTQREFESLAIYFHGLSTKSRAEMMCSSVKTLYTFNYTIMSKFRVKKLQDLTAGHSYKIFSYSKSLLENENKISEDKQETTEIEDCHALFPNNK